MCYSVEVTKEINKLLPKFGATIDLKSEEEFKAYMSRANDLNWSKELLGLSRKPNSNPVKLPGADSRIYPGYFGEVLVLEKGKRVFKLMRYRVRPEGSKEEIPTKFNVFNARIDSITEKKTWTPLFMKNHGLFPFVRFFEWVESDGKKKQISFKSDEHDVLWAPCLWDYWYNAKEKVGFYSFAIITDEPLPEVAAMGHDRCPIFLREDQIDNWLNPKGKSQDEIFEILKIREKVFYQHAWVEAA